MNERIKLLAHTAGLPTYNPDGIPTKLEKFAELIIKECINELEAHKKCDPYTGELFDCDLNDITEYHIINIKEHFGVE